MRQPTHPFATLKVEDDLLLPRVEVPHFKCLVFFSRHGAEIDPIPKPEKVSYSSPRTGRGERMKLDGAQKEAYTGIAGKHSTVEGAESPLR